MPKTPGISVLLAFPSLAAAGFALVTFACNADDYPPKDSPEAAVLRGEIVFQNYCVLCHGMKGDGQGRAARIYSTKPANLRNSMAPDAYKTLIIRKGGKALGRSEFMPPWGGELTDEQISDVVQYLRTIAPPGAPK